MSHQPNPAPLSIQPSRPAREIIRRSTRELLIPVPPITPAVTNEEVFRLFEDQDQLISLPVVEDGRPIGLINRHIFMESLARPFHREIYLRKSCIAFMDKRPLLIDEDTSIEELSFRVLADGSKVLADGFVVVRDGFYRGLGLAQDMLAALAHLQAEKNRLVMESIDYGSIIQRSLSRAAREGMREHLPDHFLIWEPRDVVSGDFYHFQHFGDGFLLVLFDCTGHGVPGAFMTLIMSAFLRGALDAERCRDPGALIGEINRKVKIAMGQFDEQTDPNAESHSDDGMDAAFCWFEPATRRLVYAGAHMPLMLALPGADEIVTLDGDRHGVGYATTALEQTWQNHEMTLPPDSSVYLFTDGVFDQLGGDKRIAFGKRRVRACLTEHRERPMPEQRQALLAALSAYQGDEPRKDDVSAIGLRV
ncbi:CBS domain-containing protein [Pseudothauera nasutitermitis]|uniref:CBS domain-containing protein n=1 Tax=Pseudothauera nasutitermitis TaxID=2565930 RepID=A0A4S4B2Y9_9RHOO|nr:SpoIIE family protein phosphatase [Pseudothauera nasutitermitis]THF66905.1 CBS domain-containing protein [Pseudothauera nasutitermitis]